VTENRWHMRAFRECATLVRETVHPDDVQNLPYIGLEHISEGQLSLIGYGTSKEVVSIKSLFRQGDILFGKLRPYFRKIIIAPFDGVCSTDIWVVRAKEGTDQRFLFYWMASNEFIEESTRASEGTKMPRAQWNFIERIVRPVPPLPIQRAIAHILGTLDKIELNRQMNATLEAIARALFKSWFVDFDPVRAKAEGRQPAGMDAETAALFPDAFVDSELGKIPKGWGVQSLDEIADFLNGLALQNFPPEGNEYLPIIKIAELRRGSTEGSDKASTKIAPEYIVQDGDVIFSWSGSLEVRVWCGGKGALNQHLFKVTSKDFPKWFYYQWILHHLSKFQFIAAGKATTMGHIQRHHLSEAKVVVPPFALLYHLDHITSPLFDRAVSNAVQSRTLAALRDALLPKLISGEIHIKDAEKQIAETA